MDVSEEYVALCCLFQADLLLDLFFNSEILWATYCSAASVDFQGIICHYITYAGTLHNQRREILKSLTVSSLILWHLRACGIVGVDMRKDNHTNIS
jgi:hypothetical protein